MLDISNEKYGWRNFKYYFLQVSRPQSGWVVPIISVLLISIRILDIFNIIRWTYFSFLVRSNHKLKSDLFIDTTVVIKFICAILIFYQSWYENTYWLVLSILFALTTFASIPEAIIFKSSRPIPSSYIRSTVLGIFNYLELVFHFASFYAYTNCLKFSGSSIGANVIEELDKIDYLYFSFITVSTIGYGHLEITKDIGYKLVIGQAFIFLMFVLIFINLNISKIEEVK